MSTPRPRRVLVAVEQLRRAVPGGIGTYARGLLNGLCAVGQHEVDVTLLASRPPRGGEPLEQFGRPVVASRLPGPALTRAWSSGIVVAPPGYDVVHSVSLAAPYVRSPSASVVTVHDLSWRSHPEATTPRGRRWHEAALRRALRDATAFVVPSLDVAGELREAGAPDAAVHIIPGGTDHLPEPDAEGASRLLSALGVAGPYLLTVGTIEPRKNLPRLFAAYVQALRQLPERLPLVVVGPRGWGRWNTDQVPEGVVPVGEVADGVLAGLYATARTFLYVPLTEGYGLPPLEAMTFGVPVVASSRVPSVVAQPGDDSMGGGQAALRADPFDVDAIAAAVVQASTDDRCRRELIAGGLQLTAGRSWRRVALHHAELWRSVG